MHIHLVHRAMRIQDNTSLIAQMKVHEKVLVVFIFTPEQISPKKNKYFSNNGVQFMVESLHELSQDVKKYGGKLLFFHGDTMKVLKSIHKKQPIESISFNYEYTPYGRERSDNINTWAKTKNIIIYEKEDYVLFDLLEGATNKKDNTPYLVYTPYMRHLTGDLDVREVDKFHSFDFMKGKELEGNKYNIDEKDIDDYYTENPNINVHGGRSNTLKILKKISNHKDYTNERNDMTYRTTMLGASNKFGTCSIREVYHTVLDKLGKNSGLIRELIWRDFYMNVTYNFPHILKGMIKGKNISYRKEYDNIKWSYNKEHFRKWCESETGFPIVDACLREMNTTGFMHNRGRMIVANFFTKDLHLDWRMGEMYFATKLCDYDPSSNSGGWMWCTGNGTDAQPWFRIFNPWSQQEKFDSDCIYIKKWLPELKDVPNKEIHNWYKPEIHKKHLDNMIDYYAPMVVHDEERKETLKIYKAGLK
jgi:deoxyribodipyrimidine photo-lyase